MICSRLKRFVIISDIVCKINGFYLKVGVKGA